MRHVHDRARDFEAIAADFGTGLAAAAGVDWGDSDATFRLDLVDGRVVAARRRSGPAAPRAAVEDARRRDALVRARVSVPSPARIIAVGPTRWTVTPWIDGPTGAAMLDHAASAATVAVGMGEMSRLIARVDARGLGLDSTWADPDSLASAGRSWLEDAAPSIDTWTSDVLHADVASILASRDQRSWPIGVAHGDYAPINVIRDPDGGLVVLDLDDLCLAPSIFDLAWWGWVVRFHHPSVWATAWPLLLEGAALQRDAAMDRDATSIGRLRCLQRAVEATGGDDRTRWLRRLSVSATWTD